MTHGNDIQWWLQQAGRYPLLTPQQELTLGRMIQAWQEDPSPTAAVERRGRRARDRLVVANLRLVVVVARRYQRHVSSAMGFSDLIQGGNLGLCRAAEKYDPTRGYRFTTYAYWWIQQGICSVVDRESRTIRMPTTFAPRLHAMGRATQQLIGTLGREPTRQELAEALGMRLEDLDAVMAVGSRCSSLDRLRAEDGDTFLDVLAAPDDPDDSDEQLQDLRERLAALPHTLAALVIGRFGLDGAPRATLKTLACQHGLTTAEVRGRLVMATRLLGVPAQVHQPPDPVGGWLPGEQLNLDVDPVAAAPVADAMASEAAAVVRRARRRRFPAQQLALLPA